MVDRVFYSPDRVFYAPDLVTYDEAGALTKSVTAFLDANITSLATTKSVTAFLDANILAPTAKSAAATLQALVQVLRVVVTSHLDAAVGVFVIGGAAMQAWLSHTKVVTTSTGTGDLVLGAAVPTWDAFSSVLDGMEVDVFIEHESQPQNETGRYTYDHDTFTLLRASTGVVERSTSGVATKVNFAAGNKRVAITVNALTLLNLTLYRGSGRTIFEGTDWSTGGGGGEFQINLSDPTHRSLVIAGVGSAALTQSMTVTLPTPSNAEWGDEIYIEKSRTAGHFPVTVSGLSPAYVLRGPGDWMVVKVVGTTSKTWELRTRGNAEMIEDVVPAALTVDGRHVGRMERYTGAGHTWTMNNAGRVGSVMVVNEGTGPIAILNGTAAIGGAVEIPAGAKGEIVYSQQGARATVLSDKMRLSTGTSAAVPFSLQTPFSINQIMGTSGPIPAAGFGIWPNSGQDETARIVAALNALMGEGPNPTLGRKRSLGFANGTYLISNLTDVTHMQVVGEHGTVFQYNGAAGAGTWMWKIQLSGANASSNFSKFRRVKFNGQSPGAGTPMPEMGIWFTTAQNWAAAIADCHFFNIGLTPVRLLGASTFSAVDCRADSFGGSMIVIDQPQPRESTIAVERGSCSWLDPANIADWITQGYIPGTGSTPDYWGRAVVELQHPGGAGGGTFVSLRDFSAAWGTRVGHPYTAPGGTVAAGGHAVILDRNVSTNLNRYNRILVQNLRGTADSTRQVVGFTGTLGMEPIVTAHQASQDGGSARPIFNFTRNAAWGNAFTTSFHWTGQGLFFSENGGPMLAAASGRPPAHNSMRGETFVATDTGLESFCDGAAWVDSTAGAGVPSYQAVTEAQATAGYQILRTSADVTVELIENLNNSGTFALPDTGLVEGDIVRVFRTGRGSANWIHSDATLGGVLVFRHDLVQFQRAGGAWKKLELGKNPGVRRETSSSRTLFQSDNGARLAATAAGTYFLPLGVAQATGWQVTLEQRGTNAYVTLDLDTAGPNPLIQVGSALLQTTYDGDALVVDALGTGGDLRPQVKVSHRPVETAALATNATTLFTSTTAGRPRYSAATGAVVFQLDNIAPVGASGLLIKGPGDIQVQLAANVQYGQEGADFNNGGPSLLTGNFECQGVMGWEVMAFDTTVIPNIRKYLITGQTSLSLADPLNLESGDIIGVLQPPKGGTGLTSLSALHATLGSPPYGYEPLYPDLPVISASALVSAAHVAGVNPVNTTAADVTLTIPSGLSLTTVPIGTQFRYLRRGVANELSIVPADVTVTLEVPTGSAAVARQNLSEIFLRRQSASSYRLSGDLRTNSPTTISGAGLVLSDAHRGLVLRLTATQLDVPAAANLSFGFYCTVLVDSGLDFHIQQQVSQGPGSTSYGSAIPNKIVGPDAISLWKTSAGILLVGKAATAPQLVST